MAKKYLIKLKTSRIIGPFLPNQIVELFLNGHIDCEEDFKKYPDGHWQKIESIPELREEVKLLLLNAENIEERKYSASNAFISISELNKNEEKKDKETTDEINNDDRLEEKSFDTDISHSEFKEFTFKRNLDEDLDDNSIELGEEDSSEKNEKESEKQSEIEKTRIIKRENIVSIDKTLIVNSPPSPVHESGSKEESDHGNKKIKVLRKVEGKTKSQFLIRPSEETQFLDIRNELQKIKEDAKNAELDIQKEISSKEDKVDIIENNIIEDNDNNEKDTKKKPMKPIVALAFIVVIYSLLFPDEDEKKGIEPLYLKILAPTTKEFENEKKSKALYNKGLEYLSKGTYYAKLLAANNFKKSLEEKYEGNPALGELIFVYSDLFENVKDKKNGASTLFKLIETARFKVLKSHRVALGSALFFARSKKYYTAMQTIENYSRINKPTIDLFCTYLDVLTKAGELDRAHKLKGKIINFGKLPLDCYVNLIRFYRYDEDFDKVKDTISKALETYPGSVALFLERAEFSLRNENWKEFANALKTIKKLEAERSPIFYAKYLEYVGILSAKTGDNKLAAGFFKTSLNLNETQELRSRLAALEIGGTYTVENLILESKIFVLMRKAKKAVKRREWQKAFNLAIEAADLNETFIPAQLLLADIQVKRGFYGQAIETLERLKKEFPLNAKVNFSLINAFIQSRKISEANNEINLLSSSKVYSTPEYASILARFFLKSKKILLAIQWFRESIKRNPLNDRDYYLLAETFLTHRRYKRAKKLLVRAIALDPLNENYHSLYGKILYELEGVDVAIGYLRDQLESNMNSARILGDIAIYYYREGKINEFEEYKAKVEGLSRREVSFYEFLIKSSEIEQNYNKIIRYGKELIKVDPGNIETRMLLGEYFLKIKDYNSSLEVFNSIVERLKSYPKVYYFIAKVYIEMRNFDEALKAGLKEIENNPKIYYGHFITGEVYRLMAKYPEAISNLEKAISIDGRSSEALTSLAWIKFNQNYLEVARELYTRALKYDTKNPIIRRQLGHVYKGIGQGTLAIEEYKTYLKLDPAAVDRDKINKLIRQLSD